MPRFICPLLLLLTFGIPGHSGWAAKDPKPHAVQVITSNSRPVIMERAVSTAPGQPGPKITILNLDAVDEIEQQLNANLPGDLDEARVEAERRIAQIGQHRLEERLRKAYQALIVAMEYSLDRYPAVIFDHRAVVYGVTDLAAASRHYRQWLVKQREEGAHE